MMSALSGDGLMGVMGMMSFIGPFLMMLFAPMFDLMGQMFGLTTAS